MKFKCLNTYNKVKDIFVKPKKIFKFYKGPANLHYYGRDSNPYIRLGKENHYTTEFITGKHIWNKDYLDSCSKLGRLIRSIIKPEYTFPYWCKCKIYDIPEYVKVKEYNSYSFQYNPAFIIVIFGFVFSWEFTAPTDGSFDDDAYWESICIYLDTKDLEETFIESGLYTEYGMTYNKEYSEISYPCLKRKFVHPKYRSLLNIDNLRNVYAQRYIKEF